MGTRRTTIPGGSAHFVGNVFFPQDDSSAATGPTFPFADDPQTPDAAWDLDGKLLASPDLAVNGWTVLAHPGGAPMTRNGEIANAFTSDPPSGTYRSSIVDGQLWVQLPKGANATVQRAAASGKTYRSRVRSAFFGGGSGDQSYCLTFASTGIPVETAGVNYFRCGNQDIHVLLNWFQGTSFHALSPNRDSDPVGNSLEADQVVYLNIPPFTGTQDLTAYSIGAFSGFINNWYPGGSVDLGAAVAYVGVLIGSASSGRPNLFYFDYIRRQTLNQFP